MDGYVGFHAALRHSYNRFIKDLAKQCKQLVRHHLDSATSPYSQVCYENFQGGSGSGVTSMYRFSQPLVGSFSLELSEGGPALRHDKVRDQENIPPEKDAQETTPGKGVETREALRESQLTVPETPSPDQPCDMVYGGVKKEVGNEHGARKRQARMIGHSRNSDNLRLTNAGSFLFGNADSGLRSGSAYSDICSSAAQHFARIREVLVERSVMSTLNSGFLTPWWVPLYISSQFTSPQAYNIDRNFSICSTGAKFLILSQTNLHLHYI